MASAASIIRTGLLLASLSAAVPAIAQTAAKPASASPKPPAAAPSSPASPAPSPSPAPIPAPAILPNDSGRLLGLKLADSWLAYGVPAEVFSMRGQEAWQDDVVFRFSPGYSFFWYKDRLWQIRFQPGYSGSVYGVFLGDSEEKLVSTLGQPFAQVDGSYLFKLPFRGFELRLRAVMAKGAVSDLYVYRADF